MARQQLGSDQLASAQKALPDWDVGADVMRRTFQFADFAEAFGFMARCALYAERLDHHPEWCNVYGRVEVRLTTHDSGGVTASDIELATLMDRAAGGSAR